MKWWELAVVAICVLGLAIAVPKIFESDTVRIVKEMRAECASGTVTLSEVTIEGGVFTCTEENPNGWFTPPEADPDFE